MTYATVEQANEYHAARLSYEAWSALSPGQQQAALQSATDALDLYAAAHGGWRQDYTQAPPEPLQAACCLEALALTDATTMERIQAQAQGVTATSMGSASESYNGAVALSRSALADPKAALLLAPYLRRAGGGVPIL